MPELFIWQKNFLRALRTHGVVIFHGNISDMYVYRDPPYYREVKFDELITRLLFPGSYSIISYDPYSKALKLSMGEADSFVTEADENYGAPGFDGSIDSVIVRIAAAMENENESTIWLLKYMHNVMPHRTSYSEQEALRLIAFQRMIENIRDNNKLLFCYLSDTRVPAEFSENSHTVAYIRVPMPGIDEREAFWQNRLASVGANAADRPELVKSLAKLTDGLALTGLRMLVKMAEESLEENMNLNALKLTDWEKIIAQYKFGETEDYYKKHITIKKLKDAKKIFTNEKNEKGEKYSEGEEGIKGQDYAIDKAIKMLWKARTNVSALLRGSTNAPRGILFLPGPSGTGKTMLAKKIAKFVFGSEDALHRFDMSDYMEKHAVSRLIGAPPGYVGYEEGGTLTNAVLEKPFSVILMDEFEKAHPAVFDILLQILSDGRLTDSRGQVVFFSQTIILFTSNIGTAEDQDLIEARNSKNPEKVREHFIRSVKLFFKCEISRPELLNRIGDNIVPFNYLDDRDVHSSAVRQYLDIVTKHFNEEYAAKLNLQMEVDKKVVEFIVEKYGNRIKEFGGKAVLNVLDDILLPLIARKLLISEDNPAPSLTTVKVIVKSNGNELDVV